MYRLMCRRLALSLVAIVYPLTLAASGPTVYASGINQGTAAGVSRFNPQTGLATQNVAFQSIKVNAQVTADGTKAVYVAETVPGSFVVVVYSMQSGVMLGSIPVADDGNLALSPNSVLAFVNTVEGGFYHVVEINLDSLAVVLDVSYSVNPGARLVQPIAVSADGGTVFTEDNYMLYALDAATLQVTNSNSAILLGEILVTPDGKYLFDLVDANAPLQAVQFVSTSTLAPTSRIDLPPPFASLTENIVISGDGSTIAVLQQLTYIKGAQQQPIGLLDLAKGTFTYTLLADIGYSAVALNQNGSTIYLGDGTGLVSFFNPQTSTVVPGFAAAGPVASLQARQDGALYAGYLGEISSVVAVDLSTNELASTFALPTGSLSAYTILENAAGTKLYASGRPTVAALPQPSPERFGPVLPTATSYTALAWNADQSGIWAASGATLDLLNPNTLAVERSIVLDGADDNGLVITPDQTKAVVTFGNYVDEQDGSGAFVVDLVSGSVTSRLALYAPGYVVLSPNGNLAYITSVRPGRGYPQPYYPEILVLDLETYEIVQQFPLPVGMNREPLSIAVSADGATLYTTAAGKVFALNATDGNVIWSVTPGVETVEVATIPGSTDLITTDSGSSNLTRLNSAGQVIANINVGTATAYLTVVPN